MRTLGIDNSRIDVSSATNGATGSSSSAAGSTTTNAYQEKDDDSISGFFRSLFGADDDDARAYSHVARRSDCVVTVHASTDEEARRAATILDQYGSVDVNDRAAQYGYTSNNWTGSNQQQTTGAIPIIEENLQVGKREVETGGAQIRSRIVERPVEEHLRLRSEHVRVERREVDRPATEADFNNFKEGELNITERAEVPVVNKEARVVGEVALNKEVEEREEVVRGTVRSTEVDVENLNKDTTRTRQDGTQPGYSSDQNRSV